MAKIAIAVLLVLMLLVPVRAHSTSFDLGYGAAPNLTAQTASIALRTHNVLGFTGRLKGGAWFDRNLGHGAWAFVGMGPQVRAGALELNSAWCVGGITHPDAELGGPFQFHQEFQVLVRDPVTNMGLGVEYNHTSSAGIYMPNNGRDMIQLIWSWGL